jgi:hypothetical protein
VVARLVLGEAAAAKEVRETRSYPLRYRLRTTVEPVVQGEFRCTGLIQTAVDVMVSNRLSQALVVADGLARRLRSEGVLPADATLMAVADNSDGVVGGFDGKAKYVDAGIRGDITADEAVYREKLREDRIRALGFGFARWSWADVDNPDRLRRKLLAAGLRPRNRG